MAEFTIRVELHDAKDEDYEKLHKAMEERAFKKTITSSEGVTYQLPTAEYRYDGEIRRKEVLEKAKSAATKTGRKAAILVTESLGCTWSGLDKE